MSPQSRPCVGIRSSWRTALLILVLIGGISVAQAGGFVDPKGGAGGAGNGPVPFSAERLVRALTRSNREDSKLQALREAEEQHRDAPELPDALWQAIQPARNGKKPVTLATIAAVRLYASLDNDAHLDRQIKLLRASDIHLVLPAAASLAERRVLEAFPLILGLRDRPEYRQRYGVRHGTVWAVAQYPKPEAIRWLIETLVGSEGQLKYEVARLLSRMTGENFGGISKDWRQWWNRNESEFDMEMILKKIATAPPVDNEPLEMPWEESVPRLFHLPIYARRVLFIVDVSGSVDKPTPRGSQLDAARAEIERSINDLPANSAFSVLSFDDVPRLLANRLVPASPTNKAQAVILMESMITGGKTACYEALETGLSIDPNLELVFFLSDGDPTAGKIVSRPKIEREIMLRNVTTRVTIHTVGMNPEPTGEVFLKRLSQANFGAYHTIQ